MHDDSLTPLRLLGEQVDSIAANGVVGAASGLFGALVIGAALVWIEPANPAQVALWMLLLALSYAVQAWLCLRWRRDRPAEPGWPNCGRRFVIVAGAEGVIWGIGIVWFCATGPLEQELLIVLIAGGIAGAVSVTFGSYMPAYAARFLPATLPYVAWAALAAHGHTAIHAVLAISVLAFVAANMQLARGFNAGFLSVQRARFENLDLAAALGRQKEAAEAATLAKSRFLAAASHDLRQPVHALSLFVGALHNSGLPPHAERLLEHIGGSVAAVDSLFAALLDISRLDAGAVRVSPTTFPITPLLDRIRRDHLGEAAEKRIELRLLACSALVATDAVLLERVLRNLVSNAIRYTDAGRVIIGCRRGASLRVEIWDTGRGIPQADQARVFEEFHQLHRPGAERGPGLGLGLAIVRRLSDLLGLGVSVCSQEGRGSCFSLNLALGTQATPPDAPLEDVQPPGAILVIDDNAAIKQAMGTLLTRWGHAVSVAGSAAEAEAVMLTRPDLIICDFHLADANGIDTIGRLRRRHGYDIAALLVTADTSPDLASRARSAGLLLLNKPVSNARLRAAVGSLLRRERSRQQAEIRGNER